MLQYCFKITNFARMNLDTGKFKHYEINRIFLKACQKLDEGELIDQGGRKSVKLW